MRTLAKMTFGGIVAALLVLLGPTGYEKVAKLLQPLPLSPLAKVVLEKLETSSWTIQQDGISCDTLWIRGETDARNPKTLTSDDLKTCSIFIRQGGLSKELALNDQLQTHEVKVILPKAKEMYLKLMAEKNAETATKILADSEKLDPTPVKKKPAPQFTKNGKLIYDSLTSNNWKLANDKGYSLISKNKGALNIDLTGSDKAAAVTLNEANLELNAEETILIVQKAKTLKAEIIQANVEAVVQSADVRITAELAPMPSAK